MIALWVNKRTGYRRKVEVVLLRNVPKQANKKQKQQPKNGSPLMAQTTTNIVPKKKEKLARMDINC
jgi:hypothetical protein